MATDYYTGMEELPEDDQRRIETTDDGIQIEFGNDGEDIIIDLDGDPDVDVFADSGFPQNLAAIMQDGELRALASELDEMVDADIASRAENDRLIEKALQLLGLEDLPDEDSPFSGASQLNHPVLAEAVINFQARAMEEFFPPAGPVKGSVMGEKTEEKAQKAYRVEGHMNYQLTEKDEGYYDDTDQMLLKLPIYGTMFRRGYQDVLTGEPRLRSVPPSRCHVPYDARSIQDSPRITYEYKMHENDLRRAMDKGAFRRIKLHDVTPEESSAQNEEDTSDKRIAVRATDDNVYTIREVYIDRELPDEIDEYQRDHDFALPYIITYCTELNDVLSIRRNWRQSDNDCRKRIWITVYRYLPGIGFYGWGLLHVIGKAAEAGSASLRALLDAAAGSNMPGGFVSKEGAQLKDGDLEWEPGVFKKVNISADELAKAFKDLPVKEPSQALFNLFSILIDSVRGFANKTEQVVGDASNTGPVGTTMALIEESMKVFSGIHKRIHAAARREFKILHVLNGELMTEQQYAYDVEGESRYVLKEDFDEEVDVIPVSDPNIWSSTQRIAQAQALLQAMKEDNTGVFDEDAIWEVYRRLLQALRVPELEKILPDKRRKRLDPVSENQMIQLGKAVRAFPEQDHDAHIAVHQHYLAMVAGNGDPEVMKRLEPVMKAHIVEHIALKYRSQLAIVFQQQGIMLPEFDPFDRNREELPPEIENQIALMAAQLAPQAIPAQPPAPQGPPPEQIEAEAEAKKKEAETAAEIERENALTAAEIERKDAAAAAERKRKDEDAAAEIRRDDIRAGDEREKQSAGMVASFFAKLRGNRDADKQE